MLVNWNSGLKKQEKPGAQPHPVLVFLLYMQRESHASSRLTSVFGLRKVKILLSCLLLGGVE